MTTHATFVSAARVSPLNLAAFIAFQMLVGGAALATDAIGPAQSGEAGAQTDPRGGGAAGRFGK